MKNSDFWKEHYCIETDPEEVEKKIMRAFFVSHNRNYELIYFANAKNSPNILVSQGSGGHAWVFAELAYQMHLRGYNVFIMPKHGGYPIETLMQRQRDALRYISENFSDRIGVYSEGLGGFVTFYLTLTAAPVQSAVYQNSPALLTEEKFHDSVIRGGKKFLFTFLKLMHTFAPNVKLPISSYLNWKDLVDRDPINRRIEMRLVKKGYLQDPDFDKWYPLSAVLSLLSTPAPNPLTELKATTLFMVALRGFGGARYAEYLRDLYNRLPVNVKKIEEVDGSVYWMLSHPKLAARRICEWFDATL